MRWYMLMHAHTHTQTLTGEYFLYGSVPPSTPEPGDTPQWSHFWQLSTATGQGGGKERGTDQWGKTLAFFIVQSRRPLTHVGSQKQTQTPSPGHS